MFIITSRTFEFWRVPGMNGAANNPQMVLVWRGDKRSVSFAEEKQNSKKPIITVNYLEN